MRAAPRAVISRPWQRYVLPRSTPGENGQQASRVDRPAYTVCEVERLHEALRRHDVFVEPSEHCGDARAKLLQREHWDHIPTQICQKLRRLIPPQLEYHHLSHQLQEADRL